MSFRNTTEVQTSFVEFLSSWLLGISKTVKTSIIMLSINKGENNKSNYGLKAKLETKPLLKMCYSYKSNGISRMIRIKVAVFIANVIIT